MCANRKYFVSLSEPRQDTPKSVTVADGKRAVVKGVGSCKFSCVGGGGDEKQISLSEVLFVPELDMNLVSVGRLVQKGARVIFDKNGCTIANGDRIAAVAPSSKGLYYLQMVERANAVSGQCHAKDCIHEWHRKLGHREPQAILDLDRKGLATGIKRKSDTVDAIRDFVRLVKTQFGRPPKIIRSDQGGEYRSAELVKFLKQEGIQQQFTTAYTPQQNGVAERKNRSLVEMARYMIIESRSHYRY
ncbi:uncharacterized protein LOC134286188 [Aedes albopictus]|uniref:Integrase catalytic domain-containing protein n=1 Tax=Aedes albopictus TaxID=7160 RepID=A0ABM1Y9U7_AEDAL